MTLPIGTNHEVMQVFPAGGSSREITATTSDQVFALIGANVKVISINAAAVCYVAFGTSAAVVTDVSAGLGTNTLIIAAGETFTLGLPAGITHYAVRVPALTAAVLVREGFNA
jgi:hypothetical protein